MQLQRFARDYCSLLLYLLLLLYVLLMVALLVSSEFERVSDDGQEREESERPEYGA